MAIESPARVARSLVLRAACVALLLDATAAGAMRAQAPAPVATLRGIIIDDSSDAPVADAEVLVGGVRVRTDTRGEFDLSSSTGGRALMIVRRLGYRPGFVAVELRLGDTTRIGYALSRNAQQLAEVEVRAEGGIRTSARVAGFEARRARGIGRFITQEEIERRRTVDVSDMLRGMLSVEVRDLPYGLGRSVISRRGSKLSPTGIPVECPMQVWVDGTMHVGSNPDFVSPKEIVGIEVYAGAATMPEEFKRTHSDAWCGIILIWTRGGS